MLRVVIVDDLQSVRRGLRDLLEAEADLHVVGEARSVAEARHLLLGCSAEVAVIDVRLADGSGIELCRELRSANPSLACLILTSFDHDEALLAAILAGASGYLLKQVRGLDICRAVRQVGVGHSLLAPFLRAGVAERIRRVTVDDPPFEGLTVQELDVLQLVVDGMTNRQIATEMSLAEESVKNCVSDLLTKAGMSRQP